MKLNIHSIGLMLLLGLIPLCGLLGKYFLAILITSAVWVIIALISNRKHIIQLEAAKELLRRKEKKNIDLTKQIDAFGIIRKKLLDSYIALKSEYDRICLESIEIKNKKSVHDLLSGCGVPQTDASLKLGSKVHDKIRLNTNEQEQEN